MSRRVLRTVAVLGSLAPITLLAACGSSAKSTAGISSTAVTAVGAPGKAIVLGTSLSLTGPLGQFGMNLQAGYKEKISELNAAGGLEVGGSKRPLTLTVLDNRSDANMATQQIRELVLKDSVTALLGACTPPIVVPESLAAEQLKTPIVSSCNPVHAFQAGNTAGWKYAWDLFFDEQDQSTVVMKGLSGTASDKKVALFTDTEPDGVAERPLYKMAAAAAGLTVVGDYTFPVGTTDFSSFINDAKNKGAELVAAQMIPPDGIALWKQMKSLSFKPIAALVSKASAGTSWSQALGPIAEGTLSDDFWSPSTGKANSQQLNATLGKQFPHDLPDMNIAVLAYTVAGVMTDAIKSAGSTDPSAINTAISKTNADYPLGHIAFGATTHTSATPYLLTQWQNGNTEVVTPATPGVTFETPVKGLQ